MCMSPHEMHSWRIEELIASIERNIAGIDDRDFGADITRSYLEAKAENLREILKERADAGTYDNDHTDHSGTATSRQGRAFI